jgi:MFS family permease
LHWLKNATVWPKNESRRTILKYSEDYRYVQFRTDPSFIFPGLASMTVPMYIAETTPAEIRGRMVTLYNLFVTGGQFIASVVDGLFSKDRENGWR